MLNTKSKKYSKFNVKKFGDCFYESLSIAIFRGSKDQQEIRQELANYYRDNKANYIEWSTTEEAKPLEGNIRKNGEYAINILSNVAANCYSKIILVYKDTFTEEIPKDLHIYKPEKMKEKNIKINIEKATKLLYTGEIDKGHYEPILTTQRARQILRALSSQQTIKKEEENNKPSNFNNHKEKQKAPTTKSASQMTQPNSNTPTPPKQDQPIDIIGEITLQTTQKQQSQKEQKQELYICGKKCKKGHAYKSLKHYQNHINGKHKGTCPNNSSHNIKGERTDTNAETNSCLDKTATGQVFQSKE